MAVELARIEIARRAMSLDGAELWILSGRHDRRAMPFRVDRQYRDRECALPSQFSDGI